MIVTETKSEIGFDFSDSIAIPPFSVGHGSIKLAVFLYAVSLGQIKIRMIDRERAIRKVNNGSSKRRKVCFLIT